MSDNIDEAFIAMRSAFLAESTVVNLLGDAESIYREQITRAVPLPAITLLVTNDNPGVDIDGGPLWRPDLEIALVGPKKSVLREIIGNLDANFTIPERQPAQITSANFRISRLRRNGAQDISPVQMLGSDEQLQMIVTFWTCKVQPLI